VPPSGGGGPSPTVTAIPGPPAPPTTAPPGISLGIDPLGEITTGGYFMSNAVRLTWAVSPAAGFTVSVSGRENNTPIDVVVPASSSRALCPGTVKQVMLAFSCHNAEAGTHPYTVTVRTSGGVVVATKTVVLTVSGPDVPE
jgi:hypothetical protein